jgi:hypothetical protein
MKFDKAWPSATNSTANSTDAQVFPKTLIEQTVESTVNGLLKETFSSTQPEDENTSKQKTKKRSKTVAEPVLAGVPVISAHTDATKQLWIAFVIFAFVTLVFLSSLYQRISAMEAWLHGRLATRT